jgi:glycosyltransferase involved in cell wall biosynthesis
MPTSIEIVIPVLNEEKALSGSINCLHSFLSNNIHGSWRIVIADNGSNDATPRVSNGLVEKYPEVSYTRIEKRGRGRALRKAWLESHADIVIYMDVDLSTDLSAIPEMIHAIEDGYDLAIGSRLTKGAQVIGRSFKRELISRIYNLIIKSMFFTKFSDAQCGFKAMTNNVAKLLLHHIVDTGWFFDTELLILAEKRGFRIKDIPVRWTDDPDTRVNVARTAVADLRGLLRLRIKGLPQIDHSQFV